MAEFQFMQVDAFTASPLRGNPCAVVFDSVHLDAALLLAIAREFNLSETAFVGPSAQGHFRARYFTPAEEIPLAGHPTLAVTHALIQSGRFDPSAAGGVLRLELVAGVVPVEVRAEGRDTVYIMSQLKPRFGQIHEPEAVLPVFGLPPSGLMPGAVIQTVSTGTPQLMLPLRDLDVLRQARLDFEGYDRLRAGSDFFSPHLFCLARVEPGGNTFARHFGTPPDLMEDPFTGSATGGMGAYLWRHGLLKEPRFVAHQGHWMHRPGEARVEVVGPPDDIETVKVGGPAVTVMEGRLNI